MIIKSISPDWSVGYHKREDEEPRNWKPAIVPGSAQYDYLDNKKKWMFGLNYKDFRWMEDVWWNYRTTFHKPELQAGERVVFRSKGIDYRFEVFCNNQLVKSREGMFNPVVADLTAFLQDGINELRVVIAPVPKSHHNADDRMQADHSFKPAVSYGWDWHPRVVPSGIWDETSLNIEKPVLDNVSMSYVLSDDFSRSEVTFSGINVSKISGITFYVYENEKLFHQELLELGTRFSHQFVIENPRLWWPVGWGDQNLYRFVFVVDDEQEKEKVLWEQTTGFRQTKLLMNEGTWNEPSQFPKSRSLPPITLEINGQRIFACGTNWVHPEVFPGHITDGRYSELLEMAKDTHFNLLRVWGGGIVNKDFFYEWCDRHGLMVWQEFPLACNNYPDSPEYLEVLKRETTSIVTRLANHPSLVMWSGGNELFNSWSGMTDQSLSLRWLNALCLQHSPQIPFIPTAPLEGMAHGPYRFIDLETGEDIFQIMSRSRNTAYTEFGMSSPSNTSQLKQIIPEKELFPPSANSEAWKAHHGFDSWQEDTWLCPGTIEKYYGKSESLEELVKNGQELQAIGYRAIFEMARQQWPYCSMALNWCFNEPWITAANNSVVQYPAIAKPALNAIKKACRPQMVSARLPRFSWKPGETLHFQLFFLNHSPEVVPESETVVFVNDEKVLTWHVPLCSANVTKEGPVVHWLIPPSLVGWVEITVKHIDQPRFDSAYKIRVEYIEEEKPENTLNF